MLVCECCGAGFVAKKFKFFYYHVSGPLFSFVELVKEEEICSNFKSSARSILFSWKWFNDKIVIWESFLEIFFNIFWCCVCVSPTDIDPCASCCCTEAWCLIFWIVAASDDCFTCCRFVHFSLFIALFCDISFYLCCLVFFFWKFSDYRLIRWPWIAWHIIFIVTFKIRDILLSKLCCLYCSHQDDGVALDSWSHWIGHWSGPTVF